MASQTTKRGLYKPDPSDYVSVVTDIDNNMDNLDDAVPDSRKVNGHALTSDVTVTKGDVGLGNVDNTSDANKPISTAQQTALDGKVPTTRTVNGHPLSADVTVTKTDVGLGNVDNTSDANKPISDAVAAKLGTVPSGSTLQGEIDGLSQAKADKVSSATNGNFAGLNASGNLTDSGKKASDFVLVANIATLVETQAMIDDYYGGGNA